MKEKLENWKDLSTEERARLLAKTPIAHNDPTAICTALGWQAWQQHAVEGRANYRAR